MILVHHHPENNLICQGLVLTYVVAYCHCDGTDVTVGQGS